MCLGGGFLLACFQAAFERFGVSCFWAAVGFPFGAVCWAAPGLLPLAPYSWFMGCPSVCFGGLILGVPFVFPWGGPWLWFIGFLALMSSNPFGPIMCLLCAFISWCIGCPWTLFGCLIHGVPLLYFHGVPSLCLLWWSACGVPCCVLLCPGSWGASYSFWQPGPWGALCSFWGALSAFPWGCPLFWFMGFLALVFSYPLV